MLERVLIVHEDVQVRGFLYELVSEIGFNVLTLPGGAEALERLKKERPTLVIISDTQSDFSGIDLVKKIREFDKDLRILLIGNPQASEFNSEVDSLGVSSYLANNFDDPLVIKSIFSLLKQEATIKPVPDKKWGSILIVDDEEEGREMIGNYLRRRGFDTDTASSGEECIEKVKAKNFDAVILDITMGGMDGLLTLKRIKEVNQNVKVIMATAMQN
ncbi:MAG TPA: response regulator, partial [Candidatus Omnitrophota bacterium]|nr:response regulator [Candidatus Omnitrophota bacterium]